jgi:hypothetical protein
VYKPKPSSKPGRIWVDRTKPFALFLRTGGPIYVFHAHVWRVTVTIDPNRAKAAREYARESNA